MDIQVRTRHLEVSDSFREHVHEKLTRLEKFDPRLTGIDVEVAREQNPRVADSAIKVELTCRGKGPVVRAEASSGDKLAAFDQASARLEERLRRAADRRRDHHRGQGAKGRPVDADAVVIEPATVAQAEADADADGAATAGLIDVIGEGPLVVREKTHQADPMTLADALDRMELVGHDFFLFVDKETSLPSVVYRRRGYDYGVLRLQVSTD